MSALVVTVILTICILVYRHLTRNFNYWKSRNIPYVKPTFFFGNTYDICVQKESLGQFLQRIFPTTNSPFLGFFGFDQPFLLIRSPDIIKSVLIKDFEYFYDRSITSSGRYETAGKYYLFVINNPEWRLLRTNLAPAFSAGKLKNMLLLTEEVGDNLVKSLREKSPNILHCVGDYATDVIASCAFGISPNSFSQVSEFRQMIARTGEVNLLSSIQRACCFFAPFLVRLFGFTFVDAKAAEYAHKLFTKILKNREETNGSRGDLIDLLIKIRKKLQNSETKIDDDKIVAQAGQYLFAGIETSEITIYLAIYELSMNLDIQKRLRREINECLGNDPISYDSLKSMTYLDLIVKETLRKYPTVPFLERRCAKNYQLPGTDVTIDKGVPIYISLFGLQLNKEYFPEPQKFIPERFSEENIHPSINYLYMPFGMGPRNCPGEKFGLISTKLAIIKVIQNYEVTPTEKTKSPLEFKKCGVLIIPDVEDFYLNFKPLNSRED